MRAQHTSLLIIPLLLAACGPTMSGGMNSIEPSNSALLSSGSTMLVQLDQPIGANTTALSTGRFTATVIAPYHSTAGDLLVPVGSKVEGVITGYREGWDRGPELVGLKFTSLSTGSNTYDFGSRVRQVDLALTDDDSPTFVAGQAPLSSAEAGIAGTIITDAEVSLQEDELGADPDAIISLGWHRGSMLPQGARLTLEFPGDLPLLQSKR